MQNKRIGGAFNKANANIGKFFQLQPSVTYFFWDLPSYVLILSNLI